MKYIADDCFKGLSTTLDFIPVDGGVKNVIEGCTGYTMTGEKLRDSERATYVVLGTLSTTLDFVTLGTASGLIQGGKYVGKEVAKASIKQATKVAIQQTTGSVVMGWTSQFASEKLRDVGLSSEEIFAIHVLAGITTVGINKYKNYKNTVSDRSHYMGGKYSAFDEMSEADGLRYNKWNELRKAELDQVKINDIILTNKGLRPNPNTYLSSEYINAHLSKFDRGASIIMTKEQYINYVKGNAFIGIPSDSTQFVMPQSICNDIASSANGNISVYEKSLGFDIGHFEDGGGLI